MDARGQVWEFREKNFMNIDWEFWGFRSLKTQVALNFTPSVIVAQIQFLQAKRKTLSIEWCITEWKLGTKQPYNTGPRLSILSLPRPFRSYEDSAGRKQNVCWPSWVAGIFEQL